MKSTYEMIKRKAIESENGSFTFIVENPNEVLSTFKLGVGPKHASSNYEVYYDDSVRGHAPTVEVYITSRVRLEDVLSKDAMDTINKYDAICEESSQAYYNMEKEYIYHFNYVPSAYMADIFPSLYPHKIKEDAPVAVSDKGATVTFEKGSLAEFAISHGCDYMDMSTMTTYRGV
jgi:hypothetical protein